MNIPKWDEMKEFEREIVQRVCEKHKYCFGTGRIGYNKKGESIPCSCFLKGINLVMKGRELNERYPKSPENSTPDGANAIGDGALNTSVQDDATPVAD